jgi:hypothetical protein
MSQGNPRPSIGGVPYFLVEIRMSDAEQLELERAARRLQAAQVRLQRSATETRTIVTGVARADGRLVCLIEASNLETVQRLVSVALLPAGRIREVTYLSGELVSGTGSQG